MIHNILLRTHGLSVAIETNDSGLLEELLAYGPPGAALTETGVPDCLYSFEREASPRGIGYRVGCPRRPAQLIGDRREALDRLLRHMQITVAEAARGEIFVHAGVVAWHGRAIVLPGRSLSGKTSLVRELLDRGATYYSDEYAVFDSNGRVHPYPRPLQVRIGNGASGRMWRAQAPGAAVGSEPLKVGLIVFARYKPLAQWRARRLTSGAAFLRLLANTVCARTRPHEAVPTLRLIAAGSPAFSATRGNGKGCIEPILELLPKSINGEENEANIPGRRDHHGTDSGRDARL